MSLISRSMKQRLVRWPWIGTTATGEPLWGPPEEYTCRWEDDAREVILTDNTRRMSRNYVITPIQLVEGDLICKGQLTEITYWDAPKQNPKVFEVIRSAATPNLRNTEVLYEAYA